MTEEINHFKSVNLSMIKYLLDTNICIYIIKQLRDYP
jgi:hypothetical protein